MMQDFLMAVGLDFPLGYMPAQVSELLWTRIGLNVAPELITVRDSGYAACAFIRVTDEMLIEFLNRNFESCVLEGRREPVRFEKKRRKGVENTRLGIRQL